MKNRRVPTEFGPETRFELPLPTGRAAARADLENRFEGLRRKLLKERLADVWDTESNTAVRRAANEAAALAWTVPYPLLAFPELFEEKVRAFLAIAERQAVIKQHTRQLLAV